MKDSWVVGAGAEVMRSFNTMTSLPVNTTSSLVRVCTRSPLGPFPMDLGQGHERPPHDPCGDVLDVPAAGPGRGRRVQLVVEPRVDRGPHAAPRQGVVPLVGIGLVRIGAQLSPARPGPPVMRLGI